MTNATQFWDREVIAPTHVSWMGHPLVRDYINASISGTPHAWPIDWFVEWLGGRRFGRALSIGCGTGALERDLIRREVCTEIDAFDGSEESIRIARDLAREDGYESRIHYSVGDFNDPHLPRRRYDLVLFHQSAHHVAKLEKLYGAILRALKPDGLVYLDEYVGPSRFEWNDDLIAPQREFFARVPAPARLTDTLALPIHPDDPSEAIRSSEILPRLDVGFRILERRDYGGTLLSVLFPSVRWDAAPSTLVEEMIAAEKALLAAGHPSFHAIVVAAPKRGLRAVKARAHYFIAPKLRRLRWEIRKRLHPDEEIAF